MTDKKETRSILLEGREKEKKEDHSISTDGKEHRRKRSKEGKAKSKSKPKRGENTTTSKSSAKCTNTEQNPTFIKSTSANPTKTAQSTAKNIAKKKSKKLRSKSTEVVKKTHRRCSLEDPIFSGEGMTLCDPKNWGNAISISKAIKKSPILQTQINMPPGYYRNLANQIEISESKKERSIKYLNMAVMEMRAHQDF